MSTVGVIFGGRSGEHEVSLVSATAIIANMPSKHIAVPIGITKAGEWYAGPNVLKELKSGTIHKSLPVTFSFDTDSKAHLFAGGKEISIDVFFPILHGTFGEDGTIQGLFEILNVPYVGANVLASSVAMNKVLTKKVWESVNLPVAPYLSFHHSFWQCEKDAVVAEIKEELGFPCFVKPANLGSSVGISKVKKPAELARAIKIAFEHDALIIVEQGLNVREIECAVLGNNDVQTSVLGEVIVGGEFYDYHDKYIDGISRTEVPAALDKTTSLQIRKLCVEAYTSLGCKGLARVDVFIDKDTGRIVLNEINTMPGFTDISMYPKLWEASGLAYTDLVGTLIELAFDDFREKSALNRSFDSNSDWFKE